MYVHVTYHKTNMVTNFKVKMLRCVISAYGYGFVYMMYMHTPCATQPVTIVSSGVVALVITAMVLVVAVIGIVVVVVKVLVWTAVIIIEKPIAFEALFISVRAGAVIDMLVGVEEITVVAAAVVIALEFAVPISYFADALSDMVVDALIDVLAGVLTGIGAEVLVDANGNVFASLMTALGFVSTKPFGAFCC